MNYYIPKIETYTNSSGKIITIFILICKGRGEICFQLAKIILPKDVFKPENKLN